MQKPELVAPMVKILNEVMPQVLKNAHNVNWGQSLYREVSKELSKYTDAKTSDRYDDLEIQTGRYLYDLMQAVVDNGHDSQESVSEFANLIERVNDPKTKHALLRIATKDFSDGFWAKLSELEKKLLTSRATGPYATLEDKLSVTRSLYDPKIVKSVLVLLDKEMNDAFAGKYPDTSKIDQVKKLASDLRDACNDSYRYSPEKDSYLNEIKGEIKEFLDEKAIYAKYDRHNDKLGQPEYIVQDVIPGTEKYINYDDGRPEQPEPQKQPEPQQATIVELQQEQQIADLKKQIADMQKQMDDLRKENDNLQRKNQESITKVEKFQHVSEELQQELNAKNKENKELQTEKDQLNNMGKGELFKRFLFGKEKK